MLSMSTSMRSQTRTMPDLCKPRIPDRHGTGPKKRYPKEKSDYRSTTSTGTKQAIIVNGWANVFQRRRNGRKQRAAGLIETVIHGAMEKSHMEKKICSIRPASGPQTRPCPQPSTFLLPWQSGHSRLTVTGCTI